MKKKRTFLVFLSVLLAIVVLSWGVGQGWAQPQLPESNPATNQELKYRSGKITTAERKEAAKRNRALGLKPGIAGIDLTAPAGQPGVDGGNIGNKK